MGNLLPGSVNSRCERLISANEQKRRERREYVAKKCSDLDEITRKKILSLEFLQLREALQSDEFTAVAVLKAYVWKALKAQEAVNCVAEFFPEAFGKAEEMDEEYSGKNVKPIFYGIPFTIKGNFFVEGYDCCVGLTKFLNAPKKANTSFITFLHKNGAIPFGMTNVPQAVLSFICSNPVYGTTGNPRDPRRTCGGSSGGEAALTALGGVPFGTGSDLGGSLRIPALMCGLVTLKPTEHRFAVDNSIGGMFGRSRLALGTGFFTRNVEEQILLLRTAFESEILHERNPSHITLPFRDNIYNETTNGKLRIGYYSNDGWLQPTPGLSRVVEETADKLRALGHTLVPFQIPRPSEMALLACKAILTDGGTALHALYANEIIDANMKMFIDKLALPRWLRYVASFVVERWSPNEGKLMRAFAWNIQELRQVFAEIDEYVHEFATLWRSSKLDALICPATVIPPVATKYGASMMNTGVATALFNMLDYPAGIVPTGYWTKEDEENLQNEKIFPVGRNNVKAFMREASQGAVGFPLGVQVVGRPYEEEKVLGVMKIVEEAWKSDSAAATSLKPIDLGN